MWLHRENNNDLKRRTDFDGLGEHQSILLLCCFFALHNVFALCSLYWILIFLLASEQYCFFVIIKWIRFIDLLKAGNTQVDITTLIALNQSHLAEIAYLHSVVSLHLFIHFSFIIIITEQFVMLSLRSQHSILINSVYMYNIYTIDFSLILLMYIWEYCTNIV